MLIKSFNVLWLGNVSSRSCPWSCHGTAQSWRHSACLGKAQLKDQTCTTLAGQTFFSQSFHFVSASFGTSSLQASLEWLALCSLPISPLSALLILTNAEPEMMMRGPGNSAFSSSVMWCSCCCWRQEQQHSARPSNKALWKPLPSPLRLTRIWVKSWAFFSPSYKYFPSGVAQWGSFSLLWEWVAREIGCFYSGVICRPFRWSWASRSSWLCSDNWAGISSQAGELSSGTLAWFSKPARVHASTLGVNAQRFRCCFARSSFSFIFSLKARSSESFNPLTISLQPRLGKFEWISPFLISLVAIATWRGLLASAWQTDGTVQLLLQLGNVKSESPHGITLAGLTFKSQALCAQENDCRSSQRVFHFSTKQGVQRKVVFSTFLFSEALRWTLKCRGAKEIQIPYLN